MQISIIIVNYKVKFFLEHCLQSVVKASEGLETEIFVVDNYSRDGSEEMVQSRFPQVRWIGNTENNGFARANNQAVYKSSGEYILYLNPDTIVPEDGLKKSLDYMDKHEDVGALGCRLIDGRGQFLPESKRGFPSAPVAFFKITGLSQLFKHSKLFNRYHLGYLPEMETNEVDVLVGCFMFCRRSVISKVGSFDEDYFMYGEDIDLSYKISKAGFKNVYFPEVTVIHYKGESTSKGTLNYVKMFYKAMIIFARKHLSPGGKGLYVMLIQLAIYVRGILAFFSRIFSIVRLPLIDVTLLALSLVFIKQLWIQNVKVNTHYSAALLSGFFSSYILIWILSIYVSGGYDCPYRSNRLLRGMFIGGSISLLFYSLLPESIRFSRGITVLGALLGTLCLLGIRKVMQWLHVEQVEEDHQAHQKVIIVGDEEEEMEIRHLLKGAFIDKNIVGSISPHDIKQAHQLGCFQQTPYLAKLYKATEIIYAQGVLSFQQIIQSMQDCGSSMEYKLHSRGNGSIIGSNSKNTAGDLYTTEVIYSISTLQSRRKKRMVDVMLSLLFLLFSPLLIWFSLNMKNYFLHHLLVLEGDKTYVGYADEQFPKLKPHLLDVYPNIPGFEIPYDNREHLDWLYARHYNAWDDVEIILKKWRKI